MSASVETTIERWRRFRNIGRRQLQCDFAASSLCRRTEVHTVSPNNVKFIGTNAIPPVDRTAINPEVIIWTATEALLLGQDRLPVCAILFVRQCNKFISERVCLQHQ